LKAGALIVVAIAVVLALGIAALILGGELGSFMLVGLEILPFLILALLAQAGERRTWARVLAYIWLALLVIAFGLLVILFGVAAEIGSGPMTALPATTGPLALVTLGSLVVSIPLLFRGTRVAIARLIPISPDSLIHKVALFFLVYVVLGSLGQLVVLDGRPPLLAVVQGSESLDTVRSATGQILDMFYGLAWILPMTLVGAGYPLRRYFAEAVQRLGFTRPTRPQVLLGLALSVALVGLFTGLDELILWVWQSMGWPTTDTEAFKRLVGAGFSPVGAVAIGITAGIGEEAATRGLLQPRLGKLLPNLAFVGAHAFQYGADALISVFLMGLILAFVRSWSSTTIAALVHGTYDFIVVMMEVLRI
jgi:membrane protease YdiL (CAAX protease family)